MLSPVQQTSLPVEPVRQYLTPPPTTLPPAPLPGVLAPLPTAASPKDKFSQKDGEQDNDPDQARRQQQQLETRRELSSAWSKLSVLSQVAHEALGASDSVRGRDAALEAASIASSLRDLANSLPGFSVGSIDIPAILDSARSGVGTALQVVDLAQAIPTHSASDRQVLAGARNQVIAAKAGVESVAADYSALGLRNPAGSATHVDFIA